MHTNRRRIQQRDISIQYMYISIRIQGLFRNVPPPLIPGFAISHLQDSFWDECHILWHSMHWFWETMVPGWVIGKHKLCSWHKCTCLRPQHPLGYAQLLEGKAAILLMVVFTGCSSSGPLNSSTGESIRDKEEAACVYPPPPRAHSMSLNFPISQQKESITSLGISLSNLIYTGTLRI